jgi:nicotinate-nucleotide pyrophosphorylase
LDRVTIMPIVMEALLSDGARPHGDPDDVGIAHVVTAGGGVLAGMPVAKEAFGRMGVRCRATVEEGAMVSEGKQVAELGGPTAAMRGASSTALRFLERLSGVATGVREPAPGDLLDAYAAAFRLSAHDLVGHDGPSFRLEF